MKILLQLNAKQYHLIGDVNQCIIEGSEVLTENGYKKIENLTTNDSMVSCSGSNNINIKKINKITETQYSGDFIEIITESGKKIITTPQHTHFGAFTLNTKNKYLIYLMYKSGLGYRIGKTEIYPKTNKNKFGFKLRLNQEHGDKIWIIDTHDNLIDALVQEDVISLKYGIPKAVFVARKTQNQEQINKLYATIDTLSGAKKLLKELYYSINQPHHISKTNNKGIINIYIKLCEDGRQKNKSNSSIHTLQIHGSCDYYKEYFEDNGYKTTKDKNGWRIRKQSNNLGELMKTTSLISNNVNLVLSVKFTNKTYQQLPAAQILPGMIVMVFKDGRIIEELVIEKNIINKSSNVYDIDVDNTHNLIVDGIVTHNSIYGFSGANCGAIEDLLKSKRKTIQMTLTKNFRSAIKIVENSNKYSNLTAIPFHEKEGIVNNKLIDQFQLAEMMEDGKPLTMLARTNNTIKEIEKDCLKKKIKMKYFNFITSQDIKNIREGKINPSLKKRIDAVAPYHGNVMALISFIESNSNSGVFITSIHKSKGREFPRCVIINSIDPEMMESDHDLKYTYLTDDGDIDIEARNVHYVAVTRPKDELYFLIRE
jgi:intein/homing endonuclease